MMHSHHSIFVALLLLLLSPFLLCSHNEAKILDGLPVNTPALKKMFDSVVTVEITCTPKTSPIEKTICGGTAISKNAVLTYATCFDFFEQNACLQGATQTVNISASIVRQSPGDEFLFMVHLDNITKHPKYELHNPGSVDLALVFVGQPLPAHSVISGYVPGPQSDAKFAGWGPNVKSGGDQSELLYRNGRFADIRSTANHACKLNLPNDIIDGDVETWMCIVATDSEGFNSNAGPCLDDHGGPVFQFTDGDLVLVGVLIPSKIQYCRSGGAAKGDGFPALYMGYYLDWIFMEQAKHPLQTTPAAVIWKPANQTTPDAVIWKPANSTHNNTGPSTGPLFFSPFLLGLLTLVQFFLL